MEVSVTDRHHLRFASGAPVRAASGIARLGDGWLVAQDDSVHAAWWQPVAATMEPVQLLPPRQGHERFSEAAATKHLKPDLESACAVPTSAGEVVVLLGSGSLPARTDGVLVRPRGDGSLVVRTVELAPLYERVRGALGIGAGHLNLEGACVVGDRLRWFQRGHGRSHVPSASVDLDLAALLAVLVNGADPRDVGLADVRRYGLGTLAGLPLAITDAVSLPDGRVVISAAAEDTPDAVADGPVAGSALALLDEDGTVRELAPLPEELAGCKVEGLALVDVTAGGGTFMAVVDQDDIALASLAAALRIRW